MRQAIKRVARTLLLSTVVCGTIAASALAAEPTESLRKTMSLDGTWSIAEGGMDQVPQSFEHEVPVPGLVDLGQPTQISRVELFWEAAYGKAYAIEVSTDGARWKEVFHTDPGQGAIEVVRLSPVESRWVRMRGTQRGSPSGGYSLFEFKVYR